MTLQRLQTDRRDGSPSPDADALAVSALLDGELVGETLSAAIAALQDDPALAERWRQYRLIGEVLREPQALVPARSDDAAFLARLQSQLAPGSMGSQPQGLGSAPSFHPTVAAPRSQAANDAVFRWKLAAGFASLLAFGVLSWNLWTAQAPSDALMARGGGQAPASASAATLVVAASNPTTAVNADPGNGVMLRDPRLDAFLQAHREAGGLSALHAPAGFLRNATFEAPAR